MKRIAAVCIVISFILTLSSCGRLFHVPRRTEKRETPTIANTKVPESEETEEQQTASPIEDDSVITTETAEEDPDENKKEFKPGATIDETVLVDDAGVRITAQSLEYSNYEADLQLIIENNSDQDLDFFSGTVGYNANSVNGLMFPYAYLNCEVEAGEEVTDSITFSYSELLKYGIDEIADIELGFYSSPSDFGNHTDYYYPLVQIKTSAADSYEYDSTLFRKTFITKSNQSLYEYNLNYYAEETIYDVDGVSIVSEILFDDQYGTPTIIIETQNNSAHQYDIFIEEISINGITLFSGFVSFGIINPGKTDMLDVDLFLLSSKSEWEIYGITELKNIKLSISQEDTENENKTNPVTVEIPVVGNGDYADTSGIVGYDESGVRIIYKDTIPGYRESDKSLYLQLLIENKSGKTVYIDNRDNSISLNGITTVGRIRRQIVENDKLLAWEIEIPESSLGESGIKEASDIKEISFGINVSDEYRNSMDRTVVIKLG